MPLIPSHLPKEKNTLDLFLVKWHVQKVGVTADLASYNILLKSCCLAGRVDLAKDIYNEVRKIESMGVLKLDVFTYSTMIKVNHCFGCPDHKFFSCIIKRFWKKKR